MKKNIPKPIDLLVIPPPSAMQLGDDLVKTLSSESIPAQESQGAGSSEVIALSKAMVAIANQSWRIAGSLIDPETQEPKSELSNQEIKKIGNALEGIRGVLTELGIAVIDKVGKPYDFGLCEQVVTEEPSENISEDRIIRTIKPTIEWNGTRVQVGSIDIAVAIKKND